MDIDRETCHRTDQSREGLADKLSALFQNSGLFGRTGDQTKLKADNNTAQCAARSSAFELPPLVLTRGGYLSANDQQQSIDASISKLEPVVGKTKLAEAMTHMAKLPQIEKSNFLRSLNLLWKAMRKRLIYRQEN